VGLLADARLTGGYWDGIHPDSPLVKKYGCRKYPINREWWRGTPGRGQDQDQDNHQLALTGRPAGEPEAFYVMPPPSRAAQFWTDWFTELRRAGITFLKIDNQAATTSLEGVGGVAEALTTWETRYAAAAAVFGPGRVIHCMSHSEAMWAGPLGLGLATHSERFVWRNSDDFGINHRSPYAHQQHIFTNLMNALVSNHMATIPDADMFMTARQHAPAHALLRALFPGPLLLTDKAGEHDAALLWRLAARDRAGTARVLKAPRAAEPLARRLLDTSILDYKDGTGEWAAAPVGPHTIVAVWNNRGGIDKPCHVRDALTVHDLEDALAHEIDDSYFVLRMGVDKPSVLGAALVQPGDKGKIVVVDDINMLEAASFWVARAQRPPPDFGGALAGFEIAVLGLVDHFAGPAALHRVELTQVTIDVQLKNAGKLGVAVAAPYKPEAFATIDRHSRVKVKVTKLPSLPLAEARGDAQGDAGGLFLLTVDVDVDANHGERDGDMWDVQIELR
jgi:hypothetical protein